MSKRLMKPSEQHNFLQPSPRSNRTLMLAALGLMAFFIVMGATTMGTCVKSRLAGIQAYSK